MKKKIITLIIMTAMAASVMAGCSFKKTPTAEELMAGCFPTDMETLKANMVLEFAATAPMEELGEGANMSFEMKMDADMEADDDTTLMSGSAEISILGMQVKEEMKQYTQIEDNEKTVYNYSPEDDMWTYGVEEAEETDNKMTSLDVEKFTELTLIKPEKDDKEYIVTAKISAEDMAALSNMDMNEMLSMTGESIEYDELVFDAEFTFDKETRHIKSYQLKIEDYEKDGVSIDRFKIEVKDMKFSNDDVDIPNSIVRDAIPYEEAVYGEEETVDVSEDTDMTEPETLRSYEEMKLNELENSEASTENPVFEVPEEDIDTMHAGNEEIPEEETEEGMAEAQTMAMQFFEKDTVYLKDLSEYTGLELTYENTACNTVLAYLSMYSKEEYLDYMQYWEYMSDNEKTAAAYMTKFGFVTAEEMADAGVDADELQSNIDSIK